MTTCPCDERHFPPAPDIPAGLDRLPRQIATFGEFRRALLDGIDQKPPLDLWRAREGDDFGVMILEWWAYVLDVLSFYSGEIAGESYLRAAVREASVRRLVDLIGYTPKPPLAASATVALFAELGQPVLVPKGTAFRSEAFDTEAPQIFESGADTTIVPSLNAWTIAPIRPPKYETGPFLLSTDNAGIRKGDLVLVTWGVGGAQAGRATKVETVRLLDGEDYVKVTLSPAPSIPQSQVVAAIKPYIVPLRASMNPFAGNAAVTQGSSSIALVLDALYPQIRIGHRVVIENGTTGQFHDALVTATAVSNQKLQAASSGLIADFEADLGDIDSSFGTLRDFEQLQTGGSSGLATITGFEKKTGGSDSLGLITGFEKMEAKASQSPSQETVEAITQAAQLTDSAASSMTPTAPFTKLTLQDKGPSWVASAGAGALTLHFGAVPAGEVVRMAKTEFTLGDLTGGADLVGPVAPLRQPTLGQVMLWDALKAGASLSGNVTDDGKGAGTLTPQSDAESFPAPLTTPVEVYGNLLAINRGESVEEVLGAGDATRSFQRFTLGKAPLTYLVATGTQSGRLSTLEVWVDGVKWTEIASLFMASPMGRVYTARRTTDGETEITFGDGLNGQRPPTGGTITAKYRYGGGAASPPAGAIKQLAKQVKGVTRALNPLAAFGGDDGDDAADIKTAAPDSALSLGRAVSLIDFEAIARGYRGILNAAALMAWDEREQRAAVKVWFIPPTDDQATQLRKELEAHLRAISAEGTPITVEVANKIEKALSIDVAVAANRSPADVEPAVLAVLTDEETGLLAKRNVPIGRPIFRADILAAVRGVGGVDEVRGLQCGGAPAPYALEVGEGEYLLASVVGAS